METNYKIEKNIPVPIKAEKNNVYPWKHMKVGDSFLVPLPSGIDPFRIKATIYQCASRKKRLGQGSFLSRVTDDGIRVWRTK